MTNPSNFSFPRSTSTRDPSNRLGADYFASLAKLAFSGIGTEFPNNPAHVLMGPTSLATPRELHPTFFGCFDWHSSVHSHWMLIRLMKAFPDAVKDLPISERLDQHFSPGNLQIEARYFDPPQHRTFERMYGWAWILRLVTELASLRIESGREWREHFRPLEQRILQLIWDYLPRLEYPIRTGVHPNTAFALAQFHDYATAMQDETFREMLRRRGRGYFEADEGYELRFEPSGEDFFSPSLMEADLMRRILPSDQFEDWLCRFLPCLGHGTLGKWLVPLEVRDPSDGRLVHLAGLNLSRAWALRGIASKLQEQTPLKQELELLAARHSESGLPHVFSGHYEGEHWLATFAVYLLTDTGIVAP